MDEATTVDELDAIDDENLLKSMLDKSEDFDYRRRIRSRLRALNKSKQPASEVNNGEVKGPSRQQQQQQPARVHQPKETRAAATLSSVPKKTDGIDGHRTNQNQQQSWQTKANTNLPKSEHQSVILRKVEPGLKSNQPREYAKSELSENVTLKKVGDTKSSSAGTSASPKSDFLDGRLLRRVEDVKPSNEYVRKSAAPQKSEFIETVTLRKVEGAKTSGTTSDSTNLRAKARNFTPKMAMEHFKGMDSATSTRTSGDGQAKRFSSTNNIRQAMLDWCQYRVSGYKNVDIVDFSNSWSDGMAFCALVHSFFPDAFDYDELDPKAKRQNLQLAFTTAEELGGVFPLLDVDDMIHAGPSPDWKSVFTYVNSIYCDLAAHKKKPSVELKSEETPAAADDIISDKNQGDLHDSGNEDNVLIDSVQEE